jgi:hypothetical protein
VVTDGIGHGLFTSRGDGAKGGGDGGRRGEMRSMCWCWPYLWICCLELPDTAEAAASIRVGPGSRAGGPAPSHSLAPAGGGDVRHVAASMAGRCCCFVVGWLWLVAVILTP